MTPALLDRLKEICGPMFSPAKLEEVYRAVLGEIREPREASATMVAVQVGQDVVVFPDASVDEAVVLVGRSLSEGRGGSFL